MTNKTNLFSLTIIVYLLETVDGQCSGSVLQLSANASFQDVASVNYPFNYGNNLNCVWRIQAANDTDAIRLEITDAVIEYHADCVYDYGEIFDGYNSSSTSLGKFCGTGTPNYVTSANYMTIVFISDYSLSGRGFKARYKSGERSSLLDPEESDSKVDAIIILGASIGAVVLIIIIMAIIFTYIQAKKAKEIRRNPHLRGVASTSRVEPFTYDYGPNDIWGPPPPPPYGDMYSSTLSPPPAYSETDPNPLQEQQQIPGAIVTENIPSGQAVPSGQTSNVINNSSTDTSTLDERSDCNANTRFIRTPVPVPNSQGLTTNSIQQRTQQSSVPIVRTLHPNTVAAPTTNHQATATRQRAVNRPNPAVVVNSTSVINVPPIAPTLSQRSRPQASNSRINSNQRQNTQRPNINTPSSNQTGSGNGVVTNNRRLPNRGVNESIGQTNSSSQQSTLQSQHNRAPSDVSDISLPGETTATNVDSQT